ncbi:hypothetical protein [Kribbella hippodromi]|uniref:hypothetical protein n=1 Tax=Kribbella hippodromi TaxID=434347 RepID=UPI0031DBA28F
MTTPTISAADALLRARWAAGTALAIVQPSAVRLRNGQVWLTSRDDTLSAQVMQGLEELLSRRAADRVSDARLLAEAVGVIGSEVARARGELPARGATEALDRFLRAPGQDQNRRTEAEAMLRVALSAAAADDRDAAERLRRLPGSQAPVSFTRIVSASAEIERDAQLLGAAPNQNPAQNPAQESAPGPARQRSGARPEVGSNHRRAEGRRVFTPRVRGTSLNADANRRPAADPILAATTALNTLGGMSEVDLASASVTEPPVIDLQNQRAILRTTVSEAPQHVHIEVGSTTLGATAQGIVRAGTAQQPHVLRLPPGLGDAEIRYALTHQLALLTQEISAAQAERPRGVLGRLRSVFGHDRRDRRLHADYAAFQVTVRDWHQTRNETLAHGRPSGPRTLEDLERDLNGLARTIRRHGGTPPTLPWEPGAMLGADVAAFGVAAARASQKPARNSVAHLRAEVVTQIESLESAVAELKKQSATKAGTAEIATSEAEASETEAAAEDEQLDLTAPERARALRNTATTQRNKARRHTEISGAYAAAAGEAQSALDSYRDLLSGIDAGEPQARLGQLAGAAHQQVGVYERSREAALPVKDMLLTGVPEGQPLDLPVNDINRMLAANGIRRRMPTRGPLPLPSAEYRRLLSEDGMVFSVPGDGDGDLGSMPQVRLRMRPRNIREITNRDFDMAEQMSGTLGEGGTSVGTTNTHSTGLNIGVNLQVPLALAAPGTPLHAAAQVLSPKVTVSRGRTLADNSGATGHYQSGWVSDNRGESVLCEWDGVLEMEVRSSPYEEWSPVESIDAGQQQTWVSSAYTVKAPAQTVTLAEIGRGQDVTGAFPRHTVDSIDGLQGVAERLTKRAQAQYGDLDEIAYNHIAGLIVNDSPRLLRELSQPGGITRSFNGQDGSEYELTWELEPVWSSVELKGESSTEMWMEEVLVDFAGNSASQTYGASLTGTGSLGFPGVLDKQHPVAAATALNNVFGSGVNIGPNVSAGRNVTRTGGQSVSTTTITPFVHRFQGPTQGVVMRFEPRASLRKIGDARPPIVERGPCTGHLRVAENDLLRAGGRADAKAIERDETGAIRTDKEGRALLRGDPAPPTGPQSAPPWMGRGENKIRGVGKALPQNIVGADEARADALAGLRKLGLVPEIDEKGRPVGNATRAQHANYERVMTNINAPRLEAGADQACQGGLIVMLEDTGFAGTPRWRPYRLTMRQKHDQTTGRFQAEGLGTSTNENIVKLAISSQASGRSISRSKSIPWSAGVGGSHGPAEGLRGWIGKLGVKFSKTAVGRSWSWSVDDRINQAPLTESAETLVKVREDVVIEFAEITDQGDAEPLARVDGTMDVAYESSLANAAEPVFEENPAKPHDQAVQQALPVAVDAGNIADEICAAIPAIRSDSTALPALHAALGPSSLVANREWMNGSYRLPFVVTQAPGNPVHAFKDGTILPQEYQVVIRGEAASLTHVAMNKQVTVDINFTMSAVGHTSGTSKSGGFSGNLGGGMGGADGTQTTGGLSLGRTTGTSQSTTISETSGEERLLINPGLHHEFLERHKMYADIVHNGQVVRTVELPDALVQKAMAERRALELYASGKLDLPLWVAEDACERYLNDKLELPERTASGFIRRYKLEKDGVTTGLAATHTAERLAAKLREQYRTDPDGNQTGDDRLTAALDQADVIAQQVRAMHASDAYQHSLGGADIESLVLADDPDKMVDLRTQLEPQIDQVAPGLRNASYVLQGALDVNFKPRGFHGHIENMLGPDGDYIPVEVPIQGQNGPDVLLNHVTARFTGEMQVRAVLVDEEGNILRDKDGKPRLATEDAGGVEQTYDYEQEDRSASHTTSITGGVDGGMPGALGAGSAGLSTDLTTTDTHGDGIQNTNLRRNGVFVRHLVEREVVFTTEVIRIRNAGAAAMASARWKLGKIDPKDVTISSGKQELKATLSLMMPKGELADGPRPAEQEAAQAVESQADHRSFRLPEGAIALRYIPHGRGLAKHDQLYRNLTAILRQPEYLGRRGMAEFRHFVRPILKPTSLKAKIGRLMHGGIDLPPLARPGNGNSMVSVTIKAEPTGFELDGVDGAPTEGQEGHVWRSQRAARKSHSRNRRTPVAANAGIDAGLVSVGGSIGEQVKEQSSDGYGSRLEGSRFLEGQMVTVRIPVMFNATIRTTSDNGRGEQVVRKSDHFPNVAQGQMYVKMLGHRYLEALRQMEQGASLDSVLAGSRLQAVPEKLGKPELRATEYAQGQSGAEYRPYRPLLDAIEKAKTEGRAVVLQVRESDGTERLYQALPNGTMLGVNDGGFASAFSSLHPHLAMMAEGKVDLRMLYNTSSPDGSFSAKVAAALEQQGVPREVLKRLDYSTAKATMPTAPQHGARPSAGAAAGHTVTTTSHGQSL